MKEKYLDIGRFILIFIFFLEWRKMSSMFSRRNFWISTLVLWWMSCSISQKVLFFFFVFGPKIKKVLYVMHFEIFPNGPMWGAFQDFLKWSYMGCFFFFHILQFEILSPKMGPYGTNVLWTDPNSLCFSVSKIWFYFQNYAYMGCLFVYPPPPLCSHTYAGTNENFYQDDYICLKFFGASHRCWKWSHMGCIKKNWKLNFWKTKQYLFFSFSL